MLGKNMMQNFKRLWHESKKTHHHREAPNENPEGDSRWLESFKKDGAHNEQLLCRHPVPDLHSTITLDSSKLWQCLSSCKRWWQLFLLLVTYYSHIWAHWESQQKPLFAIIDLLYKTGRWRMRKWVCDCWLLHPAPSRKGCCRYTAIKRDWMEPFNWHCFSRVWLTVERRGSSHYLLIDCSYDEQGGRRCWLANWLAAAYNDDGVVPDSTDPATYQRALWSIILSIVDPH